MARVSLRLRGQVILTLMSLLAATLLVTYFVVRGLNRSAYMQQERASLMRTAALAAALARELPDDERARDRFVAQLGAQRSVQAVVIVDADLRILAPVGQPPFWSDKQGKTLRGMMRDGFPAYAYPNEDDEDLWVLMPTPPGPTGHHGEIRALGMHFSARGTTREREATEQLLLLFLLLIVALMAVAGYMAMTRLVIRPIRRLIHTVDRVGGSEIAELEETRRALGGNEIRVLSDAVDRMLARLSSDRRRIDASLDRQRELNQSLVYAQEALVRSEKLASVGQLAAGVAHEIGNPVSIILGYLEILRRSDVTNEERLSYLDDVTEATERISGIIRDLLDFSRPVREGDDCAGLDRVIASTGKLLEPQKRFREVELTLPDEASGLAVHMNEGRLQQVLVNLLMNAADAMEGRGRVSIAVEPDGERVRIVVTDQGPGIPAAEQRRVFDPFYTTKDPGEGTGLGLSICYSLVSAFGGDISLESAPGRGTTFTIELWKAGCEPEERTLPTEAELVDLMSAPTTPTAERDE